MKTMFLTAALALMLAIGAGTAHAQLVDLDTAVRGVTATLGNSIERGTRIAVLSMDAGSDAMANYLINEMIAGFVSLQGAQGFTVVDRAQLDLLAAEMHFGLTGYVDDATAQAIGRVMGVQAIVTGSFEPLAGFFRFRAQLIQVETAAILAMQTADVRNDALVQSLMGGMQMAMGNVGMVSHFNHFTTGQRWGTWALNIVPGLGSFVITNDTFGGVFQAGTGGLGWILMIYGFGTVEVSEPWGTDFRFRSTGAGIFGVLLVSTQHVYNIIRTASFRRRAPTPPGVAAGPAPNWNIALVPGSGGIEGVSVIHTRRF